MTALSETSLSPAERRVLDRMVAALADRHGEALQAIWLFGSRARGEPPRGEGSDDRFVAAVRAMLAGD